MRRLLHVCVLAFSVVTAVCIFWNSQLQQENQQLQRKNARLVTLLEEWQSQALVTDWQRLKSLSPPPYSGLATDDVQWETPKKTSVKTGGPDVAPVSVTEPKRK